MFIHDKHYECEISGISIADDESHTFTFGGQHWPGHTNEDVTSVWVTNSNIPFVIPEIFSTFRNLEQILIRSRLQRIQSNAVVDARNLKRFIANFNHNLTTIHSKAFSGASNLVELLLNDNALSEIHENAFVGLSRLSNLECQRNRIRELPEGIFRHLRRLETVTFNINQIEVLNGNLFINSNQMRRVNFALNNIKAIERNFLSPFQVTYIMNLFVNQCVSTVLNLVLVPNATVQAILAPCYDNFDELNLKL